MQNTSYQKKIFIENLVVGNEVEDLFLLNDARQFQAKNGPYWRLEFKDASGSIGGKIWSPQSLSHPNLQAGQFVFLKGKISTYRSLPEIQVESLEVLDGGAEHSLDLSLFLRASSKKPEDMLADLKKLCLQVMQHKPWRQFIQLIFTDSDIIQGLLISPAAKSIHHAYIGGLLEHTLSVCSLSMRIADQYPALDRQMLLAGALCHDLGKLWELNGTLTFEYTQAGRLLGHIALALERLSPLMRKAKLEPELIEHLQHLIISHHGTLEFGSAKMPASAEALALHYADDLDAKLQQVFNALAGLPAFESGWSAYVPALERCLFKAYSSPVPQSGLRGKTGDDAEETLPQQQSLPFIKPCS